MLRFILGCAILLCVTAFSFGCGEDNEKRLDEDANSQTTVEKLRTYNETIIYDNETRGEMNWAGWCAIIVGDAYYAYKGSGWGAEIGLLAGPQGAAVGAGAGAVICGAAGSYIQYGLQKTIVTQFRWIPSKDADIPTLERMEEAYIVALSQSDDMDLGIGKHWGIDDKFLEYGSLHNLALSHIMGKKLQGATPACDYRLGDI